MNALKKDEVVNRHRIRKDYSSIRKIIDVPNLIDIQKKSYAEFLQMDVPPDQREDIGLQGVFKSIFPIKDFVESSSLEFVSYTIGEPKYDVNECREKGMTYAAPLRVLVRLVVWDGSAEHGSQSIRDVKEQEVFFGEIPLMTDNGTFTVNGTERVVVSQLHRSPGIFFDHDKGKSHVSGKIIFSARIIPHRGSWIDFEFDPKDVVYVRIDRRRKFPVTVLFKALGFTEEDILNYYYPSEEIYLEPGGIMRKFDPELLRGELASADIKDPKSDAVLVKKGKKITRVAINKLTAAQVERVPISPEELIGRVSAHDVRDPESSEVLLACNQEIDKEALDRLQESAITTFTVLYFKNNDTSIRNTLLVDKISSTDEALIEIYRRLRPSDPSTKDAALNFFNNIFFNTDRYDLSKVGRLKLNYKLGLTIPLDVRTLTKEDLLEGVRCLISVKNGENSIDDIDHLGNRRVRSVGELVENQYRIGLTRMERAIKERMSLQEVETLMPHDLVNSKLVSAVIKEFFGSSQLSQFMDQTNPLSEITHKRRLSALGPGGLTRERAGFEVRDVHSTHYGRICPIETPEGPNIGLIASLSSYARVNALGFVETPYRTVVENRVTDEVQYLSALEEENHIIAQANAPIAEDGTFTSDLIDARKSGEFIRVSPEEVEYMDVSPNQLVSVSASLIPFLEHDDANRALMGSNMQRQAVPLVVTEAPLVGTGMEGVVAKDSGVAVVAKRSGTVDSVDSNRIVVRCDQEEREEDLGTGVDIYNLIKYRRSNQNTCINQQPIVRKGDLVHAGEIIADGPATESGELALGRNVLVAFMPWGGYNFEDSILISDELVENDCFTSIHIEEFEVMARDTKLGKEEITRDIPNLGEEALMDLDESGIIRIGAKVKAGDVLVGKITPKGETQLSPEEKLLRAIFGEKAKDVQDTSLRVPPGVEGTIIDVKVFNRKGIDKDERSRSIENEERSRLLKDQHDEITILKDSAKGKIKKVAVGKISTVKIKGFDKKLILDKGQEITAANFDQIPFDRLRDLRFKDVDYEDTSIPKTLENYEEQISVINTIFETKINRIKAGDELPPGVIKMVKINVAVKRRLSVGDKMAGRHGNKGVLSRVLPKEDMPFLEDGTPVQIVLNPLGVPSRMNVGQILETHLGWAAKGLGYKIEEMIDAQRKPEEVRSLLKTIFTSPSMSTVLDSLAAEEVLTVAQKLRRGIYMSTPVFEGASEDEISHLLGLAGLPTTGKTILFDGRSGEAFDQKVTVGMIYMMKLHHLVEDKIHARSIGTYSLVTQQPLGGKAQFGGQRLGEMEVWALEAYGAAYTLQEFLTVKSDDVWGRTKMYEKVIKGDNTLELGIPESFHVLTRELQGLCLNVTLVEAEEAA
ncbi:MAG TPA: DNA-directed RNA polymerase subunit beta [Thermodesulfobacteriota bacterium]|nr:DNA-directed RNA polymerase subunit beta [Thermodesulfobacteriota bacterium]